MAALTFQFEGEAMIYEPKASELLMLIRRALNTLEPQKTPEWAVRLCDELESGGDAAETVIQICHGRNAES
jgi:hypothetical protein